MNLIRSNQLAMATAIALATSSAHSADGVDPVVVTAARLSEPLSDVIGSVSVITRADIQRRQVQSMQDLLRGETGVSIANNGGLGKISSTFLRGTEADQVLVLVNGVRVGSATAGTTRIEYLPVDQIERIEIVRGPRSSLYGADAMGGVIQIFTRDAEQPSITLGGGSHETVNTSASFGLKGENSWLSVSGSHIESEGFNSCRDSFNGAFFTGGCFTDEPDADGFRNASGSVRAGYRWGERADVEATALYAAGRTEYDGDFANQTDFSEGIYNIKAHLAPAANWDLTMVAGSSRDAADEFKDGTFTSTFDTERRNASVQSDWTLSDDQIITLGVDYLDDRIDSTTAYDETSRDNTGVFAQYKGRFGAHEFLASARSDDNEQFGSHTTGSAGYKWFLADRFAVHAGWGSAFLAPNFNDLYYPGFSNPDLDPEKSDSVEIGASGAVSRIMWSVAAFQTDIEDLIAFDLTTFLPQNVSKARIRGIEAEARTHFGHWSFGVGYTGLDPRNRDGDFNDGNFLPRRARQSGRVDVNYGNDDFSFGTTVNVAGSRYDDLANTTRLGSYTLVDFVGQVHFAADWSIEGRIANAFDEDYETASFYHQDGRTYFVTLRYQPRRHRS
jgi:vitamin B12 transporter